MTDQRATERWTPIARRYNPLQAGSIDGTDVYPHDRAVLRAMLSTYRPNKQVKGDPDRTLFVARLSNDTSEDTIYKCFKRFGKILTCRLVRDVVTGASRHYAFVEFAEQEDARVAQHRMNKANIDGHEVFVDFECERTLKGWIPRRLGGGFGGKKESGQLRFGGLDRPFRKPISIMLGARKGGPSLSFRQHEHFSDRHSSQHDRAQSHSRSADHDRSRDRSPRCQSHRPSDHRDRRDRDRDENRGRTHDRRSSYH